jgi:enterochelin esterase-like enzyme
MTISFKSAIGKTALFLLLLMLLSSWDLHASGDWPGFRGPNFDGSVVDGKFKPSPGGELALTWRAAVGPGYSGISVFGNTALTLFSDGTNDVMIAFDLNSGKELWRSALAPTNKGHDGSHDGPIATPTISGGKAFALLPEGELFAVELTTGKNIWKTNIVQMGGKKPFHGFAASPVVTGGVVVVEMGGDAGKAVAGFDVQTGKVKWTAGNDKVNYQSPLLIRVGGQQLVLAVGDKKLLAIDPASGKLVVDYDHAGDDAASIMVPVLLDQNRILLRNKNDSADLIRLNGSGSKITVEKIWTKNVFKNSYCVPVYYNGYLYGFNGPVLAAVDAASGETKWRTRAVGDGWVLLVDGNLVIQAKMGPLYVGPASPDGWKETAKIDLFHDISWTPPSFAGGTIFSRSQKEVARLEWHNQSTKTASTSTSANLSASSQFGKFLVALESAQDKKGDVDRFIASQKSFPLVEWPDQVTFIYRGSADDVAISGDLQGYQREESMQHVPGTDLFYYTTRLEPDARINYRYIKNFEETIADPNNPRSTKDRRGNALSWMAMPAWEAPTHLKEAPVGNRGKIMKQELPSKLREGASAKFDVYLPPGYDSSSTRYPVVYIFDGSLAQTEGLVANTLDNVLGNTVQPLIAVFLTELKTNLPEDQQSEETKVSTQILVQEVIPFVDSNYRTIPQAKSRALMGPLFDGYSAFFAAMQYPNTFGGVAAQSMWIDTRTENSLKELIQTADAQPMRIYLDWGLYDARSNVEGWNLKRDNVEFHEYLRGRGYRPAGGEVHDSYGWAAWRNRTDLWLATLFPINQP